MGASRVHGGLKIYRGSAAAARTYLSEGNAAVKTDDWAEF